MLSSRRDRFPLPVAETPPHPCAACAGRQAAKPRCRCALSTALRGRVHPRENRFRLPDIQRRTANEGRVLSPARHRSRHPHSAKLAWPCLGSVLGKEMITEFQVVCTTGLDTEKHHLVA